MHQTVTSVDVGAPHRSVYEHWIQFERFPTFMEGVEHVEQLDDERLYWITHLGGQRKEWICRVVLNSEEAIVWQTESGPPVEGAVNFEPLEDGRTRVTLRICFEPQSRLEKFAAAAGVLDAIVHRDLDRFRQQVEERV